jgi:ubiquinone/menaquinone biosynthesis C-methylase UbiE
MTQEDISRQYCNASNLNARIQLHRRFSQNKYGWFHWVFDQFDLPENARILELGSGAGNLWLENQERIPTRWDILLSDFSAGMLAQAQKNLQGGRPFHFQMIDANSTPLPLESEAFDAVIANHMLYYVTATQILFSEIHRILKPGGHFYATTVGEKHVIEIDELIGQFDPDYAPMSEMTVSFTLENGAAQLSTRFAQVDLRRYEDSLLVTEADPLVEYILSGWRINLTGGRLESFREFVKRAIGSHGGVYCITKDSGIIEAVRE